MMFPIKPEGFHDEIKVGACIIEAEGEILLLQQGRHKSNAGVWLEAGGKLQDSESFKQAMLREVFEETGLEILSLPYKKLFQRYFYYQGQNITLEMYYVKYKEKPKIIVSEEHSNYVWVSPIKSLNMNLVEDLDTIIKELYSL